MNVKNVDLTVSQLLNDLSEGLTWLKSDDLGYGNIETKYGANVKQIEAIRKHPALKNVDTSITIFNIIDDTKEETIGQLTSQVVETTVPAPKVNLTVNATAQPAQVVPSTPVQSIEDLFSLVSDVAPEVVKETTDSQKAADMFNNL